MNFIKQPLPRIVSNGYSNEKRENEIYKITEKEKLSIAFVIHLTLFIDLFKINRLQIYILMIDFHSIKIIISMSKTYHRNNIKITFNCTSRTRISMQNYLFYMSSHS
jgi:hypothetical protein